MSMEEYSINRSLSGSMILLTGVTGFIGGSLLERILRLDPGPEKIFVLIRKKEGLEPRSRFNAILESPLFKDMDSKLLERVEVLPGDVTIEGLGLSDENRDTLLSSCTHVFHSAASISFAAKLETAVKRNLLGTRYILNLTKSMVNIKSMVHVSTAYVNCTKNGDRHLEERIYPSKINPVEFIDMILKMSPEEIEMRSEEFLGDHPNTYTFTKNMAENLLQIERGNVPLSIVRPSVVLNSWKQPVSGWVDNVNNGACGFIAGIGRGVFRSFQANPDGRPDIIPVDIVVSTILAASIHTLENPEKVTIFHCTSSSENSTSWSEYCEAIVESSRKHPCEIVVWYPEARPRKNWFRHLVVVYLFQLLPAYIHNFFWQFKHPGQKYLLLSVQQKFAKGDAYMRFFAFHEWSFCRRNAISLAERLTKDEIETHPMNPSEIEWKNYFENCVLGMRRYFHKEPTITNRARRQMQRLRIMAAIAPFLTFFVFWYLLAIFFSGSLSNISAGFIAGFLVSFIIWV